MLKRIFLFILVMSPVFVQCVNDRLKAIETELEAKETESLKQWVLQSGLSEDQLRRILFIISQKKESSLRDISTPNALVYGEKSHYQGLPIDMMRRVCRREKVAVENINFKKYESVFKNNITGESSPYATAIAIPVDDWVQDGKYYTSENRAATPLIEIYKDFSLLSSEEQEIVMAHELEHILRHHGNVRHLISSIIMARHKKPRFEIYSLPHYKEYQNNKERSANILPSVRHAEIASLAAGVCNSEKNRILSQTDCALLKEIDKLHKLNLNRR